MSLLARRRSSAPGPLAVRHASQQATAGASRNPPTLNLDIIRSQREENINIVASQSLGVHSLYEVGASLGSGTVAVVKLATRREDGRKFAMKCVCSGDEERRQFARDEYELLHKLEHHAIVRAEALYEHGNHVWICMEHCADGSVESYVKKHGVFSNEESTALSFQLLEGINYLHCKRIVHRDLKPANMLLHDGGSSLKISDFNSAKQVGRGCGRMLTDRGTSLFTAPELKFSKLWNERIDIWSCGLSIFFTVRATVPFDIHRQDVAAVLLGGALPGINWGHITQSVKTLIEMCLAVRMEARPSAMHLLQQPVFSGRLATRICCPHPDPYLVGFRTCNHWARRPESLFISDPVCGLLARSPGTPSVAAFDDAYDEITPRDSSPILAEPSKCKSFDIT
mmetsp:Transcript_16758/g.47697  ORF Transcript_16758/g.47697 Transcript_16758/m.47697 type:complete len:397 (-) Transcript_16758:104-1294(-)